MRAAADDHDVVALLELRARAPHAALAEDVKHRRGLLRHERVDADRAAAEVAGASATTVHTYWPSAAPNSIR